VSNNVDFDCVSGHFDQLFKNSLGFCVDNGTLLEKYIIRHA